MAYACRHKCCWEVSGVRARRITRRRRNLARISRFQLCNNLNCVQISVSLLPVFYSSYKVFRVPLKLAFFKLRSNFILKVTGKMRFSLKKFSVNWHVTSIGRLWFFCILRRWDLAIMHIKYKTLCFARFFCKGVHIDTHKN